MKTPRQILAEAAELMRLRGKARGTFEDEQGQVCAVGAMRLAAFGSARTMTEPAENHDSYWTARKAIDNWITAWVDTAADVIDWSDRNGKEAVVNGLAFVAEHFDDYKEPQA